MRKKNLPILKTYKVYFDTTKNDIKMLQFTMRCANLDIALIRINEILKCTYAKRHVVDTTRNIYIFCEDNLVEKMLYKTYLKKYGLI